MSDRFVPTNGELDKMTATGEWQVIALIAAMELPMQPTDLGDCVVVPLSTPRWTPERGPGGLTMTPAPDAMAAPIMVIEPEVRFYAHHAITTVHRGSEDEAKAVAQERFERATGLLALAQGPHNPPPVFQVIAVQPATPSTQHTDPLPVEPRVSVRMSLGPLIVNPMTDATAGRFVAIRQMAASEEHVGTIVRLWGVAEYEHRTMFSVGDRDACMVHYVKVMEQVSILVRPQIPDLEPSIQAEVVGALAACLGDPTAADAAKIEAIDKTTKQLQQMRFAGSRRRLMKTFDTLRAEPHVRKAVIDSWDLRSSRAGHPNPKSVTEHEVTTARLAAGELLMLYFNSRWSQPAADEAATPTS